LIIPAVQVDPAQRQYWSTGSKRWPPLGPWKPWRKHKRSDCLFTVDMAGGVWDLATFEASGRVRKLHLQPLGDTRKGPSQNIFCGLKTNFPFHWLFSDLPLSWSDLERES
jgi:hypothetical protein